MSETKRRCAFCGRSEHHHEGHQSRHGGNVPHRQGRMSAYLRERSAMYLDGRESGRLRSLLVGGSCGEEEQRALRRLEAQYDGGLPHPPVDRRHDRGDHAKPEDDEQTEEHARCHGCTASAQEQQADEDGHRLGEQREEVCHLRAKWEPFPQQQSEHAGPIVQRQHEDGEFHDKRAHRERPRRVGEPACPTWNVHERSVDVGGGDVENDGLLL
jgi:hypothetical protein